MARSQTEVLDYYYRRLSSIQHYKWSSTVEQLGLFHLLTAGLSSSLVVRGQGNCQGANDLGGKRRGQQTKTKKNKTEQKGNIQLTPI